MLGVKCYEYILLVGFTLKIQVISMSKCFIALAPGARIISMPQIVHMTTIFYLVLCFMYERYTHEMSWAVRMGHW